jgi:zinc/manganese transport system substrate-binding protein
VQLGEKKGRTRRLARQYIIYSVLRLFLLGLLLVACGRPTPTPAPGQAARLPVVASFSVLADLVGSVGGERIEVVTLVGPGQDAHTFEPAPSHGVALARAGLVFENGLGFEGWLERMYAASGSKARRVVVTEGIAAREGGHAEDEAADEADEHGEIDPHVWQDARHAMHVVALVRDALAQADPAGAAAYRANADAYLAELQALDGWIVEQVRTVPEPRRTLVTNHDSFGYFASRYGFRIVGTAIPGVSTETSEPSAAELAGLVRRIKAAGTPAIFAENVANPKVLERVAQEAGVTVAPRLYTDALDRPGEPVDTYVKMMRYNVSTIVTALKA